MLKSVLKRFIGSYVYELLMISVSFLMVLAYFWPIIQNINALGIQDWDQNFAWSEFSRISLLEYHQFPFWDPFRCGGAVHFANPQMSVISLQTLFVLFFGTVVGIKVSILFHSWLGMIGFYLFARQHQLSKQASFISSIIFSFSGIVSSFLSTGMVVFISFVFLPWIFYFLKRAESSKKWLVIAAILFSACFYYGYHVSLLAIVLISIYYSVKFILKRELEPVLTLVTFFGISAILSLPKLILSFELLTIFPRLISDESGYSFSSLIYFLTSKNQGLLNVIEAHNYNYGMDENSLYVGYLPLILFGIFFIKNKKDIRKNMVYVITLLLIVLLMLGNLSDVSLYGSIRNLPIFSSFRVAQRFRFDFIFLFSLMVGFGCDRLLRFVNDRVQKKILFLLISVVIFYNLSVFSHEKFLKNTLVFDYTAPPIINRTGFVQQNDSGGYMDYLSYVAESIPDDKKYTQNFSPWSFEYVALNSNRGIINCYDSVTAEKFAVGEDSQYYKGEWYLENNKKTVSLISWSPNQFVFKASIVNDAATVDTLIINQNYYPGWQVEIDGYRKKAISFDGLLATDLAGKDSLIIFKFLPYNDLFGRLFIK